MYLPITTIHYNYFQVFIYHSFYYLVFTTYYIIVIIFLSVILYFTMSIAVSLPYIPIVISFHYYLYLPITIISISGNSLHCLLLPALTFIYINLYLQKLTIIPFFTFSILLHFLKLLVFLHSGNYSIF